MAIKELPDPELLRKLLDYDPETGILTWRTRTPDLFTDSPTRTATHKCNNWNSLYAGKRALCQDDGRGYLQGHICNGTFKSHRVIWALFHGKAPDHIDHINGVRSDNRIVNLRSVTLAENNKNMRIPIRNKSGRSGVHFDKSCNRWRAFIRYDGKRRHVGCFGSFEAACRARSEAEVRYGFHPNHGRSD